MQGGPSIITKKKQQEKKAVREAQKISARRIEIPAFLKNKNEEEEEEAVWDGHESSNSFSLAPPTRPRSGCSSDKNPRKSSVPKSVSVSPTTGVSTDNSQTMVSEQSVSRSNRAQVQSFVPKILNNASSDVPAGAQASSSSTISSSASVSSRHTAQSFVPQEAIAQGTTCLPKTTIVRRKKKDLPAFLQPKGQQHQEQRQEGKNSNIMVRDYGGKVSQDDSTTGKIKDSTAQDNEETKTKAAEPLLPSKGNGAGQNSTKGEQPSQQNERSKDASDKPSAQLSIDRGPVPSRVKRLSVPAFLTASAINKPVSPNKQSQQKERLTKPSAATQASSARAFFLQKQAEKQKKQKKQQKRFSAKDSDPLRHSSHAILSPNADKKKKVWTPNPNPSTKVIQPPVPRKSSRPVASRAPPKLDSLLHDDDEISIVDLNDEVADDEPPTRIAPRRSKSSDGSFPRTRQTRQTQTLPPLEPKKKNDGLKNSMHSMLSSSTHEPILEDEELSDVNVRGGGAAGCSSSSNSSFGTLDSADEFGEDLVSTDDDEQVKVEVQPKISVVVKEESIPPAPSVSLAKKMKQKSSSSASSKLSLRHSHHGGHRSTLTSMYETKSTTDSNKEGVFINRARQEAIADSRSKFEKGIAAVPMLKDDLLRSKSKPKKKHHDQLSQSTHSLRSTSSLNRSKRSAIGDFQIDGKPMEHWKNPDDHFDKVRDASGRIVLEPKANNFFETILQPHEYDLLRKKEIEQPFFSKYNRFFPDSGHFACKACGNALYDAQYKLDLNNGWPAFGCCVKGAIETSPDSELGPDMVEIHCHRCKSHLGNLVEEENALDGGLLTFSERHRVNGGSIKYVFHDLPKRTTATHHLLP